MKKFGSPGSGGAWHGLDICLLPLDMAAPTPYFSGLGGEWGHSPPDPALAGQPGLAQQKP